MLELPPLPDIFGNYTIRGITEVMAPPPVGWFPEAPGWRYLALLLFILALRWSWRRYQHWQRNRYRDSALAALATLAQSPGARTPAQLSRLLKATALQAYPRREVARLSGADWPAWLNRQVAEPVFSSESATLLATAAYRPGSDMDQALLEPLLAQCRRWITAHAGPGNA